MTANGRRPRLLPADQPRLHRNDYSPLRPPGIGEWSPTLDVSVVIPAHGCQDKLDLALAALAAQSYPAHLMEVIVVDDGSDPPLALPEIRPENTKLVSSAPGGRGSGHAVNTGVAASDGSVILRLDADMVTYRDHVESQMRWHHLADYVVAMGHKLFTGYTPGDVTPRRVHDAVGAGEAATLFDREAAEPHWVERFIARHEGLRTAGHMAYHVFVGATGSLRREVFDAAGGMDPELLLGGDAEFAYRVGQTGAVFVPDTDTSSWHLGRSQMQARREDGTEYRFPYLANRIPLFERRRETRGRQWEVPYVDVVVDCAGTSMAEIRETVEALLAGSLADFRLTLVGPWPEEGAAPGRAPLDDPLLGERLLYETFRAEPRVRFASQPPATDPAVTFRLLWPAWCRPTPGALSVLTTTANTEDVGLLRVVPPAGAGRGAAPPRLERVAAFARARHLAGADTEGEVDMDMDVDTAVDEVYGSRWMDGAGDVIAGEEDDSAAPADWRGQLREWQKRAEQEKKRADRLERRIRWATRAQPKRALRRLLLGKGR